VPSSSKPHQIWRPVLAWTINCGLIATIVASLSYGALNPAQPAAVTGATPAKRVVNATKADAMAGTPQAFRDWITAYPAEAERYLAFVAFLNAEGVGDILPPWQLVQSDTGTATSRCEIPPFVVPEESKWPQVVPTLWLIKERIIPAVGPVRVLSGYRTEAANRCANGAEGSPHMSFSALDLQADNVRAQSDQKELFATLCKVWHQTPSGEGFGLGAYYVRNWPGMNEEGRFHVDTIGKRTWGHSYGAYTSHCRELGYIRVKSPEQIEAEEKAKLKAEEDAALKLEEEAKAALAAEAKARAETRRLEAAAAARARAQDEAVVPVLKADQAPVAPQPVEPATSANVPAAPQQ
jgi:hypothetical protein